MLKMLLPSSCSTLLAEAVKMINSVLERKVQDLLDTFMSANTFDLLESFVPKSLPMLGLVSVGELVAKPCNFSMAILTKAGQLQVSMVRQMLSSTIQPVFDNLPSRCWIADMYEVKSETWLL